MRLSRQPTYQATSPAPTSLVGIGNWTDLISSPERFRKNRSLVSLEITLLFDRSGSMRVEGTPNPNVFHENLLAQYENASIAIYGFSDRLVRFTGPKRNRARLLKAMDALTGIQPQDTPLFQSIAKTLRQAATTDSNAIRVLAVFSDGEANKSDLQEEQRVLQLAREFGITLCPVARPESARAVRGNSVNMRYNTPAGTRGPVSSVPVFLGLADATGGRTFFWTDNVLDSILKQLAEHFSV